MINFLSSWVKNLSLALIVVSILEMLLPNNKTKKYIKMVMGLYILFSIIAPFVNNSNVLNFNIEDVYSDYSKEISSTSMEGEVNQASMDDRLNKLYKEQLESDITQKVEEKGYDVRKCKVDAHISESDTGIEYITIEIDGKNDNVENSNDSDNSNKTDAIENFNGSSKYSKNSENTLEDKIVKEIQKIQKVEIDVSKGDDSEDTNSAITKTDVKMIKDFLTKEYGVSEKCLKIN